MFLELGKIAAEKENHGDLGELGGLDAEGAEAQPGFGAVALLADYKHGHQAQQRKAVDDGGVVVEEKVGYEGDAHGQDQGHGQPQKLAGNVIRLVAK